MIPLPHHSIVHGSSSQEASDHSAMNRFGKKRIACLVCALGLIQSSAADVVTGFQGAFAPENWTTVNPDGGGSLDVSTAPASISMTSSNIGSDSSANLDFTIAAPSDGIVNFNWSFETEDGPSWDPFSALLNGTPTQLSNNQGGSSQMGTYALGVMAGDVFGFRQRTEDALFGPATTTISGFSFSPDSVSAIPEPSGVLALAFLLGLTSFNRRR